MHTAWRLYKRWRSRENGWGEYVASVAGDWRRFAVCSLQALRRMFYFCCLNGDAFLHLSENDCKHSVNIRNEYMVTQKSIS